MLYLLLLAPKIDSPDATRPAVPSISNASPTAAVPPVNAAPPILAAQAPILDWGFST